MTSVPLRSLLKMKSTAVAAMLILAIGLSANLLVFSLVNAVLIRPLPFSEPQRLVALDDHLDGKSVGVSWGEVLQWQPVPGLFESTAAFTKRTFALTDHSASGIDVVLSGRVTPGFFHVLGTVPLAGVLFSSGDLAGADQLVAILSYNLWQKRFNGDAAVVNRSLALNDVQYKIIGILPRNFSFSIDAQSPDIYIPLDRKDYCCLPSQRGLYGIARLAPGVTTPSANLHLAAIAQITARLEGLQHFSQNAFPLQAFLVQGERKTLLLLWGSVFALGLIAALNAGALLLAQSLHNLRQYALKISLGATLGHLLREQIALAAWLASIAGTAALGLSYLVMSALLRSPLFQPILGSVKNAASLWDWRVFSFCAILSFAAAVGSCTLPLALFKGIAVEQVLRGHAALSSSHRGRNLRTALIVAQLALSVMLFSAVSSMGHSLYALLQRNPGFRTKNIVMGGIGVPEARYDTDAKMIGFHQQVLASIRAIPGVSDAGFAVGAPVNPLKTAFLMDGAALPVAQRPRVALALVSPKMFDILNLTLLRGRNFASTDRQNGPLVAIVNQSFVRRYLDSADPLRQGMRIQFFNGVVIKPWSHYDVVGIIADSRNRSIDTAPEPEIYLSTDQIPLEGGSYFLDTTRPASELTTELPAAVWRVDSQVQRVIPNPVQAFIEDDFSDQRTLLYLSLSFAAIALTLATAGLASSISATVSEATREIGIRTALGESRAGIALRLLRTSLSRTLLGTVSGFSGAVIVTVSLAQRFQFDFVVLAPIAILMLLVASLVTIFPVSRALKISPIEALKAE